MNLTTEQQAAVESTAEQTLVIAGAGSGKTRVLTARVQRLLDSGVDPSSIMVLTFTRKAANELKDRIGDAGRDIMLGTFHSVALQILRADGERLGYKTESIVIIDAHDADVLLKSVAEAMGWYDGTKWSSGYSLVRFKRCREAQYTGQAPPDDRDAHLAFDRYTTLLRSMNLLDFGAILAETRRLFREYPDVLKEWQSQIRHVLVDELQDTDAVQYDLHEHFSPPATFFGVGDTRQAIYGWRGGRPDLMFERHPEAEIFHLTACFRCGSAIVRAANNAINMNGEPHEVPIHSATGRDGVVETEVCDLEMSAVHVDRMLTHYLPEDIAVLGRSRRLLRAFAQELDLLKIKSYVVGDGFDAWSGDAFRQLYAALRLTVNPGDNLAFLTIARAAGLSAGDIAHVRRKAGDKGLSFMDANGNGGRSVWTLSRMTTKCRVSQIAGSVWFEGSDDRDDAVRWWTEICHLGIAHGLDWYATREPQDDTPPAGAVTLSTIHSAKGLEWPVVFLIGCNETVLPGRMAIKADQVPEERRCFYVAVTRARERLALHARPSEYNAQSRFIGEAMGAPAEVARTVVARPADEDGGSTDG